MTIDKPYRADSAPSSGFAGSADVFSAPGKGNLPDFLTLILEKKREEVLLARGRLPEDQLREAMVPGRERRSLLGRLSSPGPYGVNIIAEVKRASPSKGPIRLDLDAGELSCAYQRGGAAAISVLTDRVFFQARPDDLTTVRRFVEVPVLRKDFVISSYQIHEAAAMGADAVLLIVRALSGKMLKDLLDLCREIQMDALVEVHSEAELDVATKAGSRLIGINNRDLGSFRTDLQTSVRVVKELQKGQIAVAESGIRSRVDILRLLDAGIWNFLIGESLARVDNPEMELRQLLGQPR